MPWSAHVLFIMMMKLRIPLNLIRGKATRFLIKILLFLFELTSTVKNFVSQHSVRKTEPLKYYVNKKFTTEMTHTQM